MSRRDREAWQAQLDADPALKAAWTAFLGTLDRVSGQLATAQPDDVERLRGDLDNLRRAALLVQTEAGEDQPHH